MGGLSGDDLASLAYFALLATAIGGSLIAQSRRNIGRTLQSALIWVMIFIGAIAVSGLWPKIQEIVAPSQSVTQGGSIALPMAPDGHYYADVLVNGVTVNFTVDTGATLVVLSQKDAARVGLDPASLGYYDTAHTANGVVATAPVFLKSVALGPVTETDVRAAVNGGEMRGSLLGMSFLSRFSRIEIANGQLVLTR